MSFCRADYFLYLLQFTERILRRPIGNLMSVKTVYCVYRLMATLSHWHLYQNRLQSQLFSWKDGLQEYRLFTAPFCCHVVLHKMKIKYRKKHFIHGFWTFSFWQCKDRPTRYELGPATWDLTCDLGGGSWDSTLWDSRLTWDLPLRTWDLLATWQQWLANISGNSQPKICKSV